MASRIGFSESPPPPKKNVNSKINLALAAASAAGAAFSLISQIPAAIAGPSLTGNSTQTFGAGASYNLQSGQSFEAIGATGAVTPFAVTATVAGITNVPVAATLNAGTSTLTAAFDTNGFNNTIDTASTVATPSFAVQAGIISLGGNAPTAGLTTASAGTQVRAGLALDLVLNQSATTGVNSIVIAGSSSPSGIIGASINSQAIGASATNGEFSNSLTVINTLSAF